MYNIYLFQEKKIGDPVALGLSQLCFELHVSHIVIFPRSLRLFVFPLQACCKR